MSRTAPQAGSRAGRVGGAPPRAADAMRPAVRRRGRHLAGAMLALVAGLGASPALACSPAEHESVGRWITGEGCARWRAFDPLDAVSLGTVSDLGNGLVAQDLTEGNACYFDAYKLVQDCASGQALLIGPERVALMDAPKRSGLQTMERRLLARPEPATLVGVQAMATHKVVALARGQGLVVRQVTLPLDCACKTAYPALKPRG